MSNLRNCLEEIQIYVGTYKKYNEGSLFGKWVKLSDYSDFEELQTAMKNLHADEDDPEFMFQDYEISPLIENMGLVSESYISDKIYKVYELIRGCSYDAEVVEAFIDCFGKFDSIEEILEKVEETYNGQFHTEVQFVENLLIETDCIPKNLPSYIYIDWERTTRDIMYDYSESNGYYFRNF